MALYQVQVALKSKSGLPEDVYVNNFHIEGSPNLSNAEELEVCDAVWDFYNDPLTTGRALREHLHPTVQQNGHTVKLYMLDEPKPRVPHQTIERNFTAAPAGSPLPEEVALVLSYRAALESGTIAARRRGRLFFGPLKTAVVQAEANSRAQPTQAVRDDLLLAGDRLWERIGDMGLGRGWVVHSPTSGPLSRWNIVHLWVDDAFDIVRNRGRSPQIRHNWPLPSA